jgi:hypothetical protein
MDFDLGRVADQIVNVEGTGQNPRSSATGQGQFIGSTWRNMIRKYAPDLAQDRSDDEINALRTNPNYAGLGKQMTRAYARENAGIIQGAGFDPSPGNVYLAHFAGPGGAVKILNADPNASAGSILGSAAVKANPFLANMTAGQLQGWATRKMAPIGTTVGLPGEGSPTTAPVPAGAIESQGTGAPGLLPLGQPAPASSPATAPGGAQGLLAGMIGNQPAAAVAGVLGRLGGGGSQQQQPYQPQQQPWLALPQLQPMQFPAARRPVQFTQATQINPYGGRS